MHKILCTIGCLACMLSAPLSGQTVFFELAINESQVPPGGTGSPATGRLTMTLNDTQDALTYMINLDGLDLDGMQTVDTGDNVTAMHIHNGTPGTTGGIAFGIISPNDDADDQVLDPVAGTITGVWENTDVLTFGSSLAAELANLLGEAMYLNVHTVTNPGGGVRADIHESTPPIFVDGFESGGVTMWTSSVP